MRGISIQSALDDRVAEAYSIARCKSVTMKGLPVEIVSKENTKAMSIKKDKLGTGHLPFLSLLGAKNRGGLWKIFVFFFREGHKSRHDS